MAGIVDEQQVVFGYLSNGPLDSLEDLVAGSVDDGGYIEGIEETVSGGGESLSNAGDVVFRATQR